MKMKYEYKKIKQERIKRNLTQQQVADALGLYLTQYRRYETGETEIQVHTLIELCNFYGISADYILEIDTKKKKQELEIKFNGKEYKIEL